jgi:uncharacterized protein (TIGR03437 family)
MRLWVVATLLVSSHLIARQQELTPAPAGPFHVAGNAILDSKGHSFLMRGTQLLEFRPETAAYDNRGGLDYGPHSATSLSAIRLRFNMNTVVLPLNAADGPRAGYFPALAKVVHRANDAELLVVFAARNATPEFWARCASYFKTYPNVMFDVASDGPALVPVVRAAGAMQPVIARTESDGAAHLVDDPNVVYDFTPRFEAENLPDSIGRLSARAPVMVGGWDLNLADAGACSKLPSDPEVVSAMVRHRLEEFDAYRISWTVSTYEPGRLIKDFSLQDATTLEDGWTCGEVKYPQAGLGRVVEGFLRGAEERSLFVVSAAGGIDVARSGFAIAYGPVMAARDAEAKGPNLPLHLGGVSVQVTDSKGVTRPAQLLWASAGWGQINFVIPAESALGGARMTIVRDDGSRSSAQLTIADTAPGMWTGVSCRGPAEGEAIQTFADGRTVRTPISACGGYGVCRTLPVPMSDGAVTRVILHASGFRYARSADQIRVTVAGRRVRVLAYGPGDAPGKDQVTIELPASLRGSGETDLMCHLNGRISNAVRIRI